MAGIFHSETANLLIDVLEPSSQGIVVRATPKLEKGEFIPEFRLESSHQASVLFHGLEEKFTKDRCKFAHGLDYRQLRIQPAPGQSPEKLAPEVVAAIQNIVTFPEMHHELKFRIIDDPQHVQKLVQGAMRHRDYKQQVEHVLSDESLTGEQRRQALDLLRENGLQHGRS